MFTLQQIKDTHSKVKSGADFPRYVQDIKLLGVASYSTYVSDGHTEYAGRNSFHIETGAKYDAMQISTEPSIEKFSQYLKLHQQAQTDYATFCRHSAETGVEKWTTDTSEMTCTYYDIAGNKMLVEIIPAV